MKFYTKQHGFYCGIDLHASTMHVCVVDRDGKKCLHRNFQNDEPADWLKRIEPFRQKDLVVGCESTFNWYWLADLCAEHDIPFVLGHALYLKAIHGGKTKSDPIDSEKLAMLLRGGNFPTGYVYPQELRSTRDLLRRRTYLVRRRAETIAHVQLLRMQHNLPAFEKKISYKSNRLGIAGLFADESTRVNVQLDLDLAGHYDQLIQSTELYLERTAKVHDPATFYRLQTIPGIGRILAMTLLYEIHDIRRFDSVGDFLSYARLVRGSHTSAGKTSAAPGRKIGNPHLKWAFSEAVPLLKRECSAAADYAAQIERQHNKARAQSLLAIKLGRGVYYMLRYKQPFDVKTFFRGHTSRGARKAPAPAQPDSTTGSTEAGTATGQKKQTASRRQQNRAQTTNSKEGRTHSKKGRTNSKKGRTTTSDQ
jgi:transposase